MDCGDFYEDNAAHTRSTCPHCNTSLEVEITRKKKFSQTEFMAILTVVDGIQISRTVQVDSSHRAGEKRRTTVREVFQHFFDVEGKNHVVARLRNSFFNNDSFNGDLELRSHKNADQYKFSVSHVCPNYRVLPKFKQLGFNGDLHNVSPYTFFTKLEYNNRAETLLKAGQHELFFHELCMRERAYRHWDSIKICIRNGYKPVDAGIYYDYLDMLSRLGKDLRSPKYVCPENLKEAHDRCSAKVRILEKKQEQARRIAQMKENEKLYREMKQAFFGICFVQGDITVKVLESVKEFLDQGDIHHHCVFTNEYFKKQDSLVMAAMVKGVPVETVEISLSTMEILQSRGAHNSASQYNKNIRKVVTKNLGQIRSIYEGLQEAN